MEAIETGDLAFNFGIVKLSKIELDHCYVVPLANTQSYEPKMTLLAYAARMGRDRVNLIPLLQLTDFHRSFVSLLSYFPLFVCSTYFFHLHVLYLSRAGCRQTTSL